jgi:hypothetical protein
VSSKTDHDASADLVRAWRSQLATQEEVQRAYLRLSWSKRQHAPARVVAWLVAGAALGVAVSSAASGTLRRAIVDSFTSPAPSPTPSSAPDAAAKRKLRGPALAGHTPPSSEIAPVQPSGSPPLQVADPAARLPLPSAEAPAVRASPQGGSVRRASDEPEATPAVGTAPPPSPVAAPVTAPSGVWERVARELRSGDLAQAERSLTELQNSGRAEDRDAAELVRGQILFARGRTAEATRVLSLLTVTARSEHIRERAAALVANNRRSVPPGPATQSP